MFTCLLVNFSTSRLIRFILSYHVHLRSSNTRCIFLRTVHISQGQPSWHTWTPSQLNNVFIFFFMADVLKRWKTDITHRTLRNTRPLRPLYSGVCPSAWDDQRGGISGAAWRSPEHDSSAPAVNNNRSTTCRVLNHRHVSRVYRVNNWWRAHSSGGQDLPYITPWNHDHT